MKIKPKKFVNFVERQPHWLSNRQGYFTMERNERVDEFPKTFMKELKNAIHSFDLRTYPDTHLIYEEVAKWLKVKNDQIIIHEGADGGLLRVFDVFISGGDRVITCSPSFAMYPVYCQMFGAKHYPLELKVKNYDYYKELQKKIKKIKPKLVAIANPNQPIEAMLSLKQIKNICKLAERFGSLVIIDEAYYHFNNVTAQPLIKSCQNLIVVRTFSKAFGVAGMRIGYTISNKKIIGYMLSIKPIYEINAFNMKLVRILIKNIKVMKNYVKEVHKGRMILKKFLHKCHIEMIGKYSNTVLFKLESKTKVDNVIKYLFKNKFIVRPMKIDNDDKYIRATLGSSKIMKKFISKLKLALELK
jgi:histidinol-phosphate aminotransferase